MLTSVIIVNWNSKTYVRECLHSLWRFHPTTELEVLVIDSGSFDGCQEMIAAEFPKATYIQSHENVGFARANNLAAKQSRGDVLFFLNPDTLFTANAIDVLVEKLAQLPNAGAVGCKLLNTDLSLQTTCIQSFPTVLNQVLDAEFLHRRFPHSKLWGISALYSGNPDPSVVEGISGAAIAVKRSVYTCIAGFSEGYFMYGEDMDLCFKIRKAGFDSYFVPSVSIVHHGGGSTRSAISNFANVKMRESILLFLRMNRGTVSAALYRPAMALNSLLRLAVLFPSMFFKAFLRRQQSAAIRKWTVILRWSLGQSIAQ